MDDQWVYQCIIEGLERLRLDVRSVTLLCDEACLVDRWNNDKNCEWRTEKWLEISKRSLPYFESLTNCIDTSDLSVEETANVMMAD